MRLLLVFAGGAALAGCQPEANMDPAVQETPTAQAAAALQAAATPPESASSPVIERYLALGTEPFWSVEVSPGQLRYSTPEDIPGAIFAAQRSVGTGGITYTGMFKGQTASLRISDGECSDGMSDTVYAYRAAFTLAEKMLNGCARKR